MAYCHTCEKYFHRLGIMRHRAMHRDKKEFCIIEMKSGIASYAYGPKTKADRQQELNFTEGESSGKRKTKT